MGSIYKEARALEGDMKKIEGRFRFKPALTTENIELVWKIACSARNWPVNRRLRRPTTPGPACFAT